MPVTAAQFKAEYAEFRLLPTETVQPKLDAAYLITGQSWGELRDHGAKLYAAHLLALSPLSEPSAQGVRGGAGSTVYLVEWERLLKQVRVFGAAVDGA